MWASCLTLCDPGDCSPPGSSVHGILQARILEWVAISFIRGSSPPRDSTLGISHGRQILYQLSRPGSPFSSLMEMQMATHSGTPAWKIPWSEEPGGLHSRGVTKSQTPLSDFTFSGIKPAPLVWKHRALTTGPQEKSLGLYQFHLKTLSNQGKLFPLEGRAAPELIFQTVKREIMRTVMTVKRLRRSGSSEAGLKASFTDKNHTLAQFKSSKNENPLCPVLVTLGPAAV